MADLAVLASPDDQELIDQAEAYEELVESVEPLMIAGLPDEWSGNGRLLSLDGKWFSCRVEKAAHHAALWIADAEKPIRGGMSGSPILNEDGAAIGVVCVSAGGRDFEEHREGGPNPLLARQLPVWLAG